MRTVLVIDHPAESAARTVRVLERAGYRAIVATDAAAAIEVACRNPIDLIVLELLLPRHDGAAVLRALRGERILAEVPAMLLTVLEGHPLIEQAMALGARACVPKTASSDQQLLQAVAHALQSSE